MMARARIMPRRLAGAPETNLTAFLTRVQGTAPAPPAADSGECEERNAEDSREEQRLHQGTADEAHVQRADEPVDLVAEAARRVRIDADHVAGGGREIDVRPGFRVRRVALDDLDFDRIARLLGQVDLQVARVRHRLER